MRAIEVTTQAQLDKALKERKPGDWIVCLGGTWDKPLRIDGNASVRAYGNASVRAYGNASVEAGRVVPVQKYPSFRGKINGGVVIEVPDLTKLSPAEWCAHYGVKVSRGHALLFKAVDDDFATQRSRAAGWPKCCGYTMRLEDNARFIADVDRAMAEMFGRARAAASPKGPMNGTNVDPRVIAESLDMDTFDLARVLVKWAGEALPVVEFDRRYEPPSFEYFDERVARARRLLESAHEAYKAWQIDNPEDVEENAAAAASSGGGDTP